MEITQQGLVPRSLNLIVEISWFLHDKTLIVEEARFRQAGRPSKDSCAHHTPMLHASGLHALPQFSSLSHFSLARAKRRDSLAVPAIVPVILSFDLRAERRENGA